MTKRHTLRYFIPTHIDGESEEYDVDFEYEDYLPNLPILHRLPYYSLAEGLDSHNVAILAAEMSKALPSNWHVPDGASAELVAKMQSYLASTVRVRDIVLNDQILDDFARQEGLAPISAEDTTAGGIPAQSRRRYVHVVLRNEDGNWKVHSYSSFMMEKR
jgi:hypothetical protein